MKATGCYRDSGWWQGDGRQGDQEENHKKILRPGEVEKLRTEEAVNYIFFSGFSAAKQLTSVSGRGAGMDVARTNERMNGQVCVESKEGEFTKLTITLPLIPAIIKALLAGVANELYAISRHVVLEVIKPKKR